MSVMFASSLLRERFLVYARGGVLQGKNPEVLISNLPEEEK